MLLHTFRTKLDIEECEARLRKLSTHGEDDGEYVLWVAEDRFRMQRVRYSKYPGKSMFAYILEPVFHGRMTRNPAGTTVISGRFWLRPLGVVLSLIGAAALLSAPVLVGMLEGCGAGLMLGAVVGAFAVAHVIWWRISRKDTLAFLERKLHALKTNKREHIAERE